jgi:hypothetical protein
MASKSNQKTMFKIKELPLLTANQADLQTRQLKEQDCCLAMSMA